MRCSTCGAPLPPGAKVCPNCGTAVPVVDSTTQEPPMPPTIYGNPIPPISPPSNYDPGIQNPYDRPQHPLPAPVNQYQSSPYNQTEPNQYQPDPYNQNQVTPNQYPMGNVAPGYPPPPSYIPPQQPARRKTRWGLIIGVIAAVLALSCIGASVVGVGALYNIGISFNAHSTATAAAENAAHNSTTTDATPATTNPAPAANTNTNGTPSGMTVDPTAASIVTNAQSAMGADTNTAAPQNTTSTFKAGDRVYVTFKLNNDKIDFTTQKVYVTAKAYVDNVLATTISPIAFDKPSPGGYFAGTYKVASTGAFELYLCYKSDCSDEKLAQVVNFTVSA